MPATESLSVYRAHRVMLGVPKFMEGSPKFYDTGRVKNSKTVTMTNIDNFILCGISWSLFICKCIYTDTVCCCSICIDFFHDIVDSISAAR